MKIIKEPSLEEIKKISELCIKNADQFVKDAELIFNNSSYGHAMSLSIFALEELGKASLCLLVINGKLQIDESWWQSFYSHQAKLTETFELFAPAEWGHAVADFIFDVYELFKGETAPRERVETLGSGQRFLENINRLIIESASSKRNFWEMLTKAYSKTKQEITQELDLSRQSGLYVGFDQRGEIVSPNYITREQAQKFLVLARQRMKMVTSILSNQK